MDWTCEHGDPAGKLLTAADEPRCALCRRELGIIPGPRRRARTIPRPRQHLAPPLPRRVPLVSPRDLAAGEAVPDLLDLLERARP